jgi:predicted GNAT family N-acyltransferase
MRTHAEPVRHAVFVEEQKVPPEIELDGFDPLSVHAVAFDREGRVLGTGRLLPDGHIGRMAVLRRSRGTGVGSALLQALMQEAQARGDRKVLLSAQTHAIPFYERFGFVAEGEEYDDAGIAHRIMRLVF